MHLLFTFIELFYSLSTKSPQEFLPFFLGGGGGIWLLSSSYFLFSLAGFISRNLSCISSFFLIAAAQQEVSTSFLDDHHGAKITTSFFSPPVTASEAVYNHGSMARTADDFHPWLFVCDPADHCLLGRCGRLQPLPLPGAELRACSLRLLHQDHYRLCSVSVHRSNADQDPCHCLQHRLWSYAHLERSSSGGHRCGAKRDGVRGGEAC